MLDKLRAEALALIAATPSCTLSTTGPAGLQASIVTCLVCENCVYVLVPSTVDHLFNLEHELEVVLTSPRWRLRGAALALREGDQLQGSAPQEIHVRARAIGCTLVEVFPLRMHLEAAGQRRYCETIDFNMSSHLDTAEELMYMSDSLAAPQGNATILLIEDEPLVRTLAARVLRGYGYELLEADDGPAALRIATNYQAHIDLLLTDMILPDGLDGRDLATQVSAQRPAIKVLYMSGYTQDWLAQEIGDPGQTFLQKPFTPASLARKVAEMLQE